MKKSIIITSIITFVATTIFWFIIVVVLTFACSTKEDERVNGTWEPIEIADQSLEIGYGSMRTIDADGKPSLIKFTLEANGKVLSYSFSGKSVSSSYEIINEGSETYLVIKGSPLAGKYKKKK